MSTFDTAYRHTIEMEGYYANDPADRGGETYMGISRVHHPDWIGWSVIDKHFIYGGKVEELEKLEPLERFAKEFYRRNYWQELSLDSIQHKLIACEVFDTAVNMGTKTAATLLQKATNLVARSNSLVVDGVIGPKTINQVNTTASEFGMALLKALNGFQFMRYNAIVEKDMSQRRFIRGWLRRVWEER